MADEQTAAGTDNQTGLNAPRALTGRHRILCSAEKVDAGNVVECLEHARTVHVLNASDEDYLHRYFLGVQPVLGREKAVRPSINNKVVENRAYQMTKDRADALVGEPVTYSVRGTGGKDHADAVSSDETDDLSHKVQLLNDCCEAADKHSCDLELAQWLCECGVAYRIVLPTKDVSKGGDMPFAVACLDPRDTFVVYRNDVFREPLFAVTAVRDELTREAKYTVYTDCERFVVSGGRVIESGPNQLGIVPVIEYQANPERMGVFEAVLSLFDAINEIESNRVDGIAQFIQSLIVFENVDMEADDWEDMCAKGAILVSSTSDMAAKVYAISAQLDQNQSQTLVDSLYKTALSICGMPFNTGGSASTSDTGAAVAMRDGWSNSENRCKETEAMWKRSERRFLKAALSVLETAGNIGLSPIQVEIKFTRRNYEAIQSKAQVLTTMLGSGKVHPRLAFEHCGMFSDPESAYDMSAAYVEEQREIQAEQFATQQLANAAKAEEATTAEDGGSDSGNDKGGSEKAANGKGTRPPSTKRSQEGDSK